MQRENHNMFRDYKVIYLDKNQITDILKCQTKSALKMLRGHTDHVKYLLTMLK